jgi:hypothetical protein
MYKLLPILLFAFGLAVTSEKIYDNSWAVIIGIDKYQNVPNLDYAGRDAEHVKSLLIDKFNFPENNLRILVNDEATLMNMKNTLSEVSLSAGENDRVLIFFAGHGQTMELPDGGEMGYLMPVDGNLDNLYASSIPMDDIKKLALMSKAKHMLFLIDACYGGLAASGTRGLSPMSNNYINKIVAEKSRQIITAGGKDEQVIEKSEWGHSAFTMNLLRALDNGKADVNDDGFITADELGLFLKEKVTEDSKFQQTPQSRRFTSQEGEFVFIIDDVNINYNVMGGQSGSTGATLNISSTPSGAEIMIADNMLGVTPLTLENYPTGEYTINIDLPDYYQVTETVELVPRGTKNLEVNLNHKIGFIKFDIRPENSMIRIANKDGQFKIVTGNQTIEAYNGNTHLAIKSPWHYPQYENVFVSTDETTEINLSLVNGREDFLKIQKKKKMGFYGALTATGVTAISYLIRGMIYNKYINAGNMQDADDFRKQTELFNTMTTISAVVSTGTWGYTLYNYYSENSLKKELSLDE